MKKHPFYLVVIAVLLIVLVDLYAFKGLKMLLTGLPGDGWKTATMVAFWAFTLVVVAGIVLASVGYRQHYSPQFERSMLMLVGLTVLSFVPKLVFVIVLLLQDTTTLFAGWFGESATFVQAKGATVVTYLGLALAVVPFGTIIYGMVRGRFNFTVKGEYLHFENLPQAFHDLRIVQLSDLHLGSLGKRFGKYRKAVALINQLKPDIIVFTGDLVNNYAEEVDGWGKVFGELEARIGKYAILGNHDYGDYSKWETAAAKATNAEKIQQFFTDIDFDLLLNEHRTITLDGEQIAILGVENWGKPPFKQYGDLEKASSGTSDVPFKLLLSHDPSHWDAEVLATTNIDLTLSGHTHGSQFGVAIGGLQWSPIKRKYPRWGGLYREGNQYLYVNRGLGYHAIPARIGMPPEITLIELVKTSSKQKVVTD